MSGVGGGSPTRYACSTQSVSTLPTDWDHYERSRGKIGAGAGIRM